jgi:hypothetical protein
VSAPARQKVHRGTPQRSGVVDAATARCSLRRRRVSWRLARRGAQNARVLDATQARRARRLRAILCGTLVRALPALLLRRQLSRRQGPSRSRGLALGGVALQVRR